MSSTGIYIIIGAVIYALIITINVVLFTMNKRYLLWYVRENRLSCEEDEPNELSFHSINIIPIINLIVLFVMLRRLRIKKRHYE